MPLNVAYLDNAAAEPLRPEVAEAMEHARAELGVVGANPAANHRAGRLASAILEDARARIAAALGAEPAEVVFTGGGTESVALALRGMTAGIISNATTAHDTAHTRTASVFGNATAKPGSKADSGFDDDTPTSISAEADSAVVKAAATILETSPALKCAIAISAVEHDAVKKAAASMEDANVMVRTLPVDRTGVLDFSAFSLSPWMADSKQKPIAQVFSVLAVGNENGVIQPIPKIVELVKSYQDSCALPQLVHTDAIQAIGRIPVNFREWQVDALSLAGHKIGGPTNSGALLIKRNTPMLSDRAGGGQERQIRGGTPDVVAAVGLAEAIEIAVRERPERVRHHEALRQQLLNGLANLPRVLSESSALSESSVLSGFGAGDVFGAGVDGGTDDGLGDGFGDGSSVDSGKLPIVNMPPVCLATPASTVPSIVQLLAYRCEAEALLMVLDEAGVCASAGSACHTGVARPSAVLVAQGVDELAALGSLRLSFGWNTTSEDVDRFLLALPRALELSRKVYERKHG